jgi:hypothetical protein
MRRSGFPTKRVLQISWSTDLERGVIYTLATGMRFLRSRGHGGWETSSASTFKSIRLEHGPGPGLLACISRITRTVGLVGGDILSVLE